MVIDKKKIDNKELAAEIAAALWERSELRYGKHTPLEFLNICHSVLVERLKNLEINKYD